MNEQEGVIKYRLEHHYCALDITTVIGSVNAWRTILFKLKLIGQSPARYGGLGYGNISQRLRPDEMRFLVSGTQTGHLDHLKPEQFAIVDWASPIDNIIHSNGPCKPSSEALTHASVYLNSPSTQAVIHVHCPEIWRNTDKLQLPHTVADIAYGTAEMAKAVEDLVASDQLKTVPLFSMLGHEDGIVAFGETLENAAITLLTQFANAIAIELSSEAS